MVVDIINVTDAPGSKHPPTQVDLYNRTLDPGSSVRLPVELITKRVRELEAKGLIAIGQVPSWYTAAKAKKGRSLSIEEMKGRTVTPALIPATVAAPKTTKLHLKTAVQEPISHIGLVVSPELEDEILDRKRKG